MADEQKPTGEQASTGEQKPAGEQKPRITLDPSKFTINDDGQVVIADPAFADALRSAANDDTDDNNGHGVMVGVIVSF
jgi:hypothetical protein